MAVECRNIASGVLVTLLAIVPAAAQQPFNTDDADVTAEHRLHVEFSNQFDVLQSSAHPNLRQNTAELGVGYGLLRGVELGVATPMLVIFNAPGAQPRTAAGIGDTSISVKYRFGATPPTGQRSFAVSASLEIPTGKREQQLGSGVADFGFNAIGQQRVDDRVTVRANAGLLIAGNTLTGVVGIRGRGLVLSGGASVVRQMSASLQLGAEVTGAFTPQKTGLSRAQLQLQVGGSYLWFSAISVDFGVLAGRFDTSPRIGAQLGLSVDF